MQGVTTLIDDILVYGKTCEEHDANLRNVVTLAKRVQVKFRQTYFGHIPSADGLKPDPGKINAIRDMEHPRHRK